MTDIILKEPTAEQLTILQKTSSGLLVMASEMKITSQVKLDEAQIILKRARDGQKFIKADLKQFLDPIKVLTDRIKSKYTRTEEELKQTDIIIAKKIMDYNTSMKVAIEKKKEEIEAKVQSGEMNLDKGIKAIEKVEQKREGFNIRRDKVLEIYDESKLPRQYLTPNTKLITDDLKAGKEIPGAHLIIREIPIAR